MFYTSNSNICDSVTGKLKILCNSMILYDTLGNIIEQGDSLVPSKIYSYNLIPEGISSQGSLILPKDVKNNLYYVFIPTVTNNTYNTYWTNPNGNYYPYDEILVHTVDMNANGGMGKVIEKNKVIIKDVSLSVTMMQACRHSNGVDWWLLKQGLHTDSNIVYRFLVTKDSIYSSFKQSFNKPICPLYEGDGQNCFNKMGNKYAFVRGQCNKLFIADFDRCTGELSNPKAYNIPIDSTTHPFYDGLGNFDSTSSGICFSPNGRFIYISKLWNIYQLDLNESDSNLAWTRIQHGADTTLVEFANYSTLLLGLDNRIYIGKWGGTGKYNSVINKPDNKGLACEFCKRCLYYTDSSIYGSGRPPNIPDFNLGADSSKVCWPLSLLNPPKEDLNTLEVFPNPASTKIVVRCLMSDVRKELYNSVGQVILTTKENEIDVRNLPKGIYFLKCEGITKKVIVE